MLDAKFVTHTHTEEEDSLRYYIGYNIHILYNTGGCLAAPFRVLVTNFASNLLCLYLLK